MKKDAAGDAAEVPAAETAGATQENRKRDKKAKDKKNKKAKKWAEAAPTEKGEPSAARKK